MRRSRRGVGVTTRVERSAQERRERAHAHLTKVRRRSRGEAPVRWPVRGVAVALLLASAGAGAALTSPTGSRILHAFEPVAIRAIHVRGAERLSAASVVAAGGFERGAVSYGESAEEIASRIAGHPWIADARAVWLASGALLVEIEERVPAALVSAPGANAAWFLDETGTAFAPADPDTAGLPLLRSAAPLEPGETDARLASALALSALLANAGLPDGTLVGVSVDGVSDGFFLEVPGLGGRVVLGRDEPAQQEPRLAQLALLLAANLPEVQRASRIDLRFADQAVLQTPRLKSAATAAVRRGRVAPSNGTPTG